VAFLKIEVLGKGCSKCEWLEKRVKEAVEKLGISARVEHVYDLDEIVSRGVVSTPALVVDGEVLVSGVVPSVEELSKLLSKRK